MNTPDAELAIFGGGPAGTVLALLAAQRSATPETIVLIDRLTPEQSAADPRVLALSAGSLQILDQVATIADMPSGAIGDIHVSQRGYFGHCLIRAEDEGVPALGRVVRYGALMRVLHAAVERSGITVRRPCVVTGHAESDDHLQWQDDRGGGRAALGVIAEGGVFQPGAASPSVRRDYQQVALIAEVRVSRPVVGRAFERFTSTGPLALLPLSEHAWYALVWCERPARAQDLQTLSDIDFLRALQARFGERVGDFVELRARAAYPLGLVEHPDTGRRLVRIANAAQALHPVAGQGLNLGLRDVMALHHALQAKGPHPDAGDRLRSARRVDRALTIGLTDTLARLFTWPLPPIRHLAGAGLIALDLLPPARAPLVRHLLRGWRA